MARTESVVVVRKMPLPNLWYTSGRIFINQRQLLLSFKMQLTSICLCEDMLKCRNECGQALFHSEFFLCPLKKKKIPFYRQCLDDDSCADFSAKSKATSCAHARPVGGSETCRSTSLT